MAVQVLFLTSSSFQGYDCPQNPSRYIAYPNATSQYGGIYANFVNSLNNTQSEDCLTLNIWSKPTQNFSNRIDDNSGLKPVLVWIYGGRFSAGSSNTPFYQGEFLTDAQDVVVVTFNFRMNIFGFPGAPELEMKNLALLDQRLAVSWVQDNIAVFGGDPSRITIAGQSSGSWAVSNWAYAFQDVSCCHYMVSSRRDARGNHPQSEDQMRTSDADKTSKPGPNRCRAHFSFWQYLLVRQQQCRPSCLELVQCLKNTRMRCFRIDSPVHALTQHHY